MEHTGTGKGPCEATNNTTWTVLGTPLLMAENKTGASHCCFGQCHSDERYPEKYEGITFFFISQAWSKDGGLQNLDQSMWLTHMICLCKAKGEELMLHRCDHRSVYCHHSHSLEASLVPQSFREWPICFLWVSLSHLFFFFNSSYQRKQISVGQISWPLPWDNWTVGSKLKTKN